jgi:hypothetical protein
MDYRVGSLRQIGAPPTPLGMQGFLNGCDSSRRMTLVTFAITEDDWVLVRKK